MDVCTGSSSSSRSVLLTAIWYTITCQQVPPVSCQYVAFVVAVPLTWPKGALTPC
jgi:hypothetical protein